MADPISDTLGRIHERIAASSPEAYGRVTTSSISEHPMRSKSRCRGSPSAEISGAHIEASTTSQALASFLGKCYPRAAFVDAIARRDKLRVLVDGMTAANDLGLSTAVPARSTIYADTYPRTIEIEANSGDPNATKPVIYRLDFKKIAAKTAFWTGRPPCGSSKP